MEAQAILAIRLQPKAQLELTVGLLCRSAFDMLKLWWRMARVGDILRA